MSERQLSTNPIGNALSNIPSLDLPSAKGIVFLLGIYILLVGPVNYLVLRWRNKLHWGWITIPVITLVFSAMSFGLGYAKRGTDLIINKIAIIQGQSDGSAQVTSYIGLFSPANQRYELEISGNNLLSPMLNYYNPWMSSIPPGNNNNNLTFVQGDPSQVRGLNINQWSMQSFMTEITFEEIGVINANLNMEDQRLVGLITNDTDYRLTDAVMILKQNFLRLGDIAVGEFVNIEMELDYGELYGPTISWKIFENQFNPSMMGAPPREQEFKRMILEAILDQQNYYGTRITPGETRSASELSTTIEVTIIGWINSAPPEVRIDGQVPQETATSLFKTQLNLRIPEQGKIIIPPGLIYGLVAEMPLSAGICGTESTALWIEKGEAIVEFALPPELSEVNIENLQFLFQTDGGLGNSPFIAIYNWETASWHPLEKTILGINVISDPADSISTDGFVRFKISPGNQDFGRASCIYTGLWARRQPLGRFSCLRSKPSIFPGNLKN